MRACVLLVFLVIPFVIAKVNYQGAETDDNDFAEFEEFDDDEFENVPVKRKDNIKEKQERDPDSAASHQVIDEEEEEEMIEDEDDEFEHLHDDEEFEGFDPDFSSSKKQSPPDLKIAKVPMHMTANWESFYLEILMIAGLVVYLINFLSGKSKNSKLAHAWVSAHKEYLETQFAVVGDDGTSADVTSNVLVKESENVYNLWCSGRVCCEGMLVTLKLLKRQDLISTISRLFTPRYDQIIVKLTMEDGKDCQDNFVFCLANKKVISKMHKDVQDLAWYCGDKKQTSDKQRLPASFQMLSEHGEVASQLLDNRVSTCLAKYEKEIEFIHISDQYCGPKSQDEAPADLPVTEKVLIFAFNVPGESKATTQDMESLKPLMQMVFYVAERVKRFRLSKEAKTKSDKNRQRVQELFIKQAHTQRAEAAQLRKEEKRRAEKDKMMAEEDPDKQRRMEERNIKKDKSKKPRMKMVKMKSM